MTPTAPPVGTNGKPSFLIKDCALVVLATGRSARLLLELRDELRRIDVASIYHHFWAGMLQPRLDEREYNNDFAGWVRHSLHEPVLAERLAALSPREFTDLDELRTKVIDLIEDRLDEEQQLGWKPADDQFEFTRSQIVVFDTTRRLESPRNLPELGTTASPGTIFYHFIDARRRTSNGDDDFSDWLTAWGDEFTALRQQLASLDPYFGTLSELREQLGSIFSHYFSSESL